MERDASSLQSQIIQPESFPIGKSESDSRAMSQRLYTLAACEGRYTYPDTGTMIATACVQFRPTRPATGIPEQSEDTAAQATKTGV